MSGPLRKMRRAKRAWFPTAIHKLLMQKRAEREAQEREQKDRVDVQP